VVKGVRRGPLYVKFESGRYVETESTDYHAGIRIYFPRLQNGVLTVAMNLVKSVEELGELSTTEGAQIARAIDDAETRADEDRRRLREQHERDLVEAEKADLMAAAKKPVEVSAESLAQAARMAELTALLTRFPPSSWSLESPDKIAHRRVILGIQPTDEDMAFLRAFGDWKEAFELWKASQAAADKARKDVAEAAAAEAAAKARAEAEAEVLAKKDAAKRAAAKGAARSRGDTQR
jgi:hypothetical protein